MGEHGDMAAGDLGHLSGLQWKPWQLPPKRLVMTQTMTQMPTSQALASSKLLRKNGGPGRDRTDDLFHAMEARSQLRHRPILAYLREELEALDGAFPNKFSPTPSG